MPSYGVCQTTHAMFATPFEVSYLYYQLLKLLRKLEIVSRRYNRSFHFILTHKRSVLPSTSPPLTIVPEDVAPWMDPGSKRCPNQTANLTVTTALPGKLYNTDSHHSGLKNVQLGRLR